MRLGDIDYCGYMPFTSLKVRTGWRTIVCTKMPNHRGEHNRKRIVTKQPLRRD